MSKLGSARELFKEHGIGGAKIVAEEGFRSFLQTVGHHFNYGHNFVTDDWDILIILDACRADLFREEIKSHPLKEKLDTIDQVYSPASTSKEFMEKCYTQLSDEELSDIHLITANGWEDECLDTSRFHGIERVWEEYHDPSIGNTPPEPVTDAAINAYRQSNASRFIIHYLQPHAPFVHCPGKYNSVNRSHGEGNSQNIWKGLQKGIYEESEILDDYAKNLEIVLDQLEILLNNMSGEVLITADHGNAIGDWGIYGHPGYVPLPQLKSVPYVKAHAKNSGSYESDKENLDKKSKIEVSDHLRDLGYI